MLPKNMEVIGVDILRANLFTAKSLNKNLSCIVADLNWLPFSKSTFGGVISVDVLEHVHDKHAAIGELARVTSKGGFFIGSSTNLLNPILWLDVKLPKLTSPFVAKFAPGFYDRHSRFSPSSLTRTLGARGYQMDYLVLLGVMLFNKRKLPWLLHSWIIFDKLTKRKPLLYFKEIIVWKANRI
jgi:SAM-dependent methyltransferase